MDQLRITPVQSDVLWENREGNLAYYSSVIDTLMGVTDLIILPEMFTTGFSMKGKHCAEEMDGAAVQWMRKEAARANAAICGSLMMKEEDVYYNRFVWMNPDGSHQHYDKRHLFSLADEHINFSQGEERIVIDYKGWKISPAICYDLRFPVWLTRTGEYEYDLLIVVANWPEPRIHHWKTLLQARAIENQCYVAASNRIGKDPTGLNYSGASSVISPKGDVLWQQERVAAAPAIVLHREQVREWRQAFPLMNDADIFELLK